MKKLLFVFVAMLLIVGLASAQAPNVERVSKYFVYVSAKATTDTIPGHQVGGPGAGSSGWIYIGGDDAYVSYWALDSVQSNVYVDYADTGVSASSAAVIPFKTVTVAAGDTLATMDETSDIGIVARTLRNPISNSIAGARYLRFRVFNLNNDNFAAAAADRVIRLTLTRIKR